MAIAGSARQGRWRSRGWIHLIFHAIKNYGKQLTTSNIQHKTLDTWYTGNIGPNWKRSKNQKAEYKRTQLALRCTQHITAEIKHGIASCFAHIRLIQKPAQERQRERTQRQQQKLAAYRRIATFLLKLHRQQQQQQMINERLAHRQGKISAHTRNIYTTQRINYAERRYRNKPSIKKEEHYHTLRAWPHQDKLGPSLAQHHPHAST